MEGIRGYRYTYGLGHLGSVDCFISKLSEKSERLETPEFASNGSFFFFPQVQHVFACDSALLHLLPWCPKSVFRDYVGNGWLLVSSVYDVGF